MSEKKIDKLCTCIIPFYNEGDRVLTVIESLLQVKNIAQIICVDDCSSDTTSSEKIKKQFPQVKLIRLEKNQGKSGAVKEGLSHVSTPYVMLLDADLEHVIATELEFAIESITSDSDIDMIIMRRSTDPWFTKIVRGDILISGDRVLRVSDLKQVFLRHPHRYQLEYAINFYMMDHKKKAYWLPYSAANTFKVSKFGFLSGLMGELTMYQDMLRYAGVIFPIKSLLFCRNEYRPPTQ